MDKAYLGRGASGMRRCGLLAAAIAKTVHEPQHGTEDQDEQQDAMHGGLSRRALP
jgi:hypothetical protein